MTTKANSWEETQILAAVLCDSTGSNLAKCRHLPPEAFSDPTCAALFRKLHGLPAGADPGLALVGTGLCEEELRRFREPSLTSSATLDGYVQSVSKTWSTAQAKRYVADFQRDVIGLDELTARITDLNGSGSRTRDDDWPAPVAASAMCTRPAIPPPALIEGMMYRGGTMLMAGPSKAHKTFTMIALGLAVATGEPWLEFKTRAAPVLYVNLELQDFGMQDRIEKVAKAVGVSPPEHFHVWNLRGKRVTLWELQQRLAAKIRELGIGLVIIDPHYKVSSISGGEENSNDSQGRLLASLEAICTQNECGLAITHHFAKGDAGAKNAIDRASGGGVFARWGDVMLTFTPHSEDEAMTVEMALRNFPPVEPFAVRWDYPRWVRDDALDPANIRRPGRNEKYSATAALAALDGMMTNAEWRKASKMPESTFRRKRDELIKDGKAELIGIHYRKTT